MINFARFKSKRALQVAEPQLFYPRVLGIQIANRPLFPGFFKGMHFQDQKAISAIQDLWDNNEPYVGIFLSKNDTHSDLISSVDQVHRTGVLAQITSVQQHGNSLNVSVFPHKRVLLKNVINNAEFKDSSQDLKSLAGLAKSGIPLVEIVGLNDEQFNPSNRVAKAACRQILNALSEISQINPHFRAQIYALSMDNGNLLDRSNILNNPSKLADFVAAICTGDPLSLQAVLESLVIEERLKKSIAVLVRELENAKLQQNILNDVAQNASKKQQEYFLNEQLKSIKKELGQDVVDSKQKLIQKLHKKIENVNIPEYARKVFDEEIAKLHHLEQSASEFNVVRNYLEWITDIPWGKQTTENFDIEFAKTVLNQDHYGLKDVKDRILEFIAVGKLRGTVQGKIITFVGPPGVGKTSIGKSVAKALGREFFRFSVGGLTDVAEIKGHRRTYIGAMPGKVIQALKKVKTENPLIMIDESSFF
jgi:Lon-like ATP-dependent protease